MKQEKWLSPVEPMQQMVIELTIDDDEGGGGPEPLGGEESESEEVQSLEEESISNEYDDGNDYYRDQLMNSE